MKPNYSSFWGTFIDSNIVFSLTSHNRDSFFCIVLQINHARVTLFEVETRNLCNPNFRLRLWLNFTQPSGAASYASSSIADQVQDVVTKSSTFTSKSCQIKIKVPLVYWSSSFRNVKSRFYSIRLVGINRSR